MAEDKKYYWLKLKKDFFKRHDIQIIEAMDNGKDYILFYIKLLVQSTEYEGELRLGNIIFYSEKMLATITNTNLEIVRSAIKTFIDFGMIEKLENGLYIINEITSKDIISSQEESGRDRNTYEYKKWRIDVFERDNYTCQKCGKRGYKLNAHHIKKWCDYIELRFNVDNGITLCEKCHKKIHRKGVE